MANNKKADKTVLDTGFSAVYRPEGRDHLVDIYLVHGFGGHPYKTWLCKALKANQVHGTVFGKEAAKGKQSKHSFSGFFKGKKKDSEVPPTSSSTGTSTPESSTPPASKVFWPADFLPDECKDARIMVWGYDSKAVRLPGRAVSQNSLFKHSRNLLWELKRNRESDVPIIFIVHSLGGIVVKDMLFNAETSKDPDLIKIVKSTRAIVFLGVPHWGSPGKSGIAEIARRAASAVMLDTNSALLNSLGLRNDDLERCHDAFTSQWEDNEFRVKTFQESRPMVGLNIPLLKPNEKIVPDYSSRLGHRKEQAETLDGDHVSMCKFDSRDSENWRKFGPEIRSIYNAVKSAEPQSSTSGTLSGGDQSDNQNSERREATGIGAPKQYSNISTTHGARMHAGDVYNIGTYNAHGQGIAHDVPTIDASVEAKLSLRFPEMEYRQRTLEFPAMNTCRWLFKNPMYKSWLQRQNLDQHHGLLWIKGKLGSGKSILLNEAARNAADSGPLQSHAVASFFFRAHGVPLEKTRLGLFRTLLHQLLPNFPDELRNFQSLYSQKHDGRSDEVQWDTEELGVLLHNIFAKPRETEVKIFVDAVDECEDDSRRLLNYFRDLTTFAHKSGAKLSVCVSSRPYPTITVPNCPQIILEDFNDQDILAYVSQRLVEGAASNATRKFGRGSLVKEVVDRSNGIFLWAVLVVEILLLSRDDGASDKELLRLVRKHIPKELDGVYSRMLEKIPQRDRWQSLHLFQWALFVARPLRLNEWSHVVGMITQPDSKSFTEWDDSPEADGRLSKLIRRLSCGLMEVRTRRSENTDVISDAGTSQLSRSIVSNSLSGRAGSFDGESSRVELIHDSVRDYFVSGKGFYQLGLDVNNKPAARAHISIMGYCMDYVLLEDMDKMIYSRTRPGEVTEDVQEMSPSGRRRSSSEVSLGSSAADYFRSSRPGTPSHHDPTDEATYSPKVISNAPGAVNESSLCQFEGERSVSAVETWLEPTDSPTDQAASDPLEEDAQVSDDNGSNSMQSLSVAEETASAADRELNPFPRLLTYVVNMFPYHATFADQMGADPEPFFQWSHLADAWERWCKLEDRSTNGTSLIHFAAEQNLPTWIEFFIAHHHSSIALHDRGIIFLSGEYWSALLISLRAGHQKCARMLMEAKIEITRLDSRGCNLLHHIVATSNVEMLEIFWNSDQRLDLIKVNHKDFRGRTPLHYAVQWGDLEMTNNLLEHGADPNVGDVAGETPLHLACEGSGADTAKIADTLLQHGANVNAVNLISSAPLRVACVTDSFDAELLKTLLRQPDVDVNYRYRGMTARDCAVAVRHYEAVALIDSHLAGLGTQDSIMTAR